MPVVPGGHRKQVEEGLRLELAMEGKVEDKVLRDRLQEGSIT